MPLPVPCRLVVSCLAAGSGLAQASAETFFFRTPSNNIHCAYDDYDGRAEVRCDIQSFKPGATPRPADCDLEWGDSFAIGEDDRIGVMLCHGDTVIMPDAEVLPYGSSWSEGGLSCLSETSGLTCRNAMGHGFSLSRAKQRVF
jgi:hypothetical protein